MFLRPFTGVQPGLPVGVTPDAFDFADVAGAAVSTPTLSSIQTPAGFVGSAPVAIAGGDAKYSINGGAFTAAPGLLPAGQSLRLQVTSAAVGGTGVLVQLVIGGRLVTWLVTTAGGGGGAGALDFSDPANSALIV